MPRNTWYIQPVVLAVLVVASVEARWSCDNITVTVWADCTCGNREGGVEIWCNNLNITILNDDNNSVNANISCDSPVTSTMTLPSLQTGHLNKLTLHDCLPSAVPVRDIMDRLGVDSARGVAVSGQVVTLPRGQLANLTDVKGVYLTGLGLSHIDPAVFGDKGSTVSSIRWLNMKQNNISELEESVFYKLKQVTGLLLTYNRLTALPDGVFANNKELDFLNLSANRLGNITRYLLYSLKNLTLLNISQNLLHTLPDGLFDNNKLLTELDLSHNRLETISSKLLHGLGKLNWLDLSGNLIHSLPDDLFDSNMVVTHLDLSNNRLENITRRHFYNLSQLKKLDLSANRLKWLGQHIWPLYSVTSLNMSYNMLTSLRVGQGEQFVLGVCFSVQHIDLTNNSLSRLDWDWSRLDRLERLVLSDNSFQTFEVRDLHGIHRNTYIHLDGNNITRVNLSSYHTRRMNDTITEIIVYLHNNPLNCDCHLHPFVTRVQDYKSTYLSDARVTFLSTNELRCKGPYNMNHRHISSLSLEELTCPWRSDGCPARCSCHYQPEGRYTVVNCSLAGLERLPHPLPVHPDSNQTRLVMADNQLVHVTFTADRWPNITWLDLSSTGLTSFTLLGGTGSLKKLNLSYNHLTSLSDDTVKYLQSINSLALHHNPWRCSCEDLQLVRLVASRAKISDEKNDKVVCQNQKLMKDIRENEICPPIKYIVALCVSVFFSILLGAAVLILWYRNEILTYLYNSNYSLLRLLVTHPDSINHHLEYDIFISFTHEDDQFISKHLLPQLEGRYKLCLHFRDWMPGEMIGRNVIRSIISSRRTIIVMSPQYLRSTWGSYEFEIAHMEGFSTLVNRMVVIVYQDIDNIPVRESVKLYMRTVTYLKWDNTPHFWKRLHYVLPHPFEDGSRIRCVLGWCWRRQRREEGYVDQEELMEQMLRLRPLALEPQPEKDQETSGRDGGEGLDNEVLLEQMWRLRTIASVLRSLKDPSSCSPVKKDDADLEELLEQMLALRPLSLTTRPGNDTSV